MLRVSLLGNLGADPEVRFNAKGAAIVSFRVAVNQVRTGPDGERQENTEWFRVRVMGRQAEFAQRLGKGSKVLVFGRLDISHYTSRDGEARTGFDVWADELQSMTSGPRPTAEPEGFMDSADADHEGALAGASAAPGASTGARGNGTGGRGGSNGAAAPSSDLEDLPF